MAKRMQTALIATVAALLMAATAQAQEAWGFEPGLAWSASRFPEASTFSDTPENRAAKGKWGRAQLVYYCAPPPEVVAKAEEASVVASRLAIRFAGAHGYEHRLPAIISVDGRVTQTVWLKAHRAANGDYVFEGRRRPLDELEEGIRDGARLDVELNAAEGYGYGRSGLGYMPFSWSLRGSSAAIGRACG